MITNSEDCYSTLSDIARNDFEQLFSFVRDIQDFMVSQLPTDQRERVTLLEIQLNFLEPLKNLAQLNQSLFEATKSRLNKDQTTLLIGWQYMIAIFYCSIWRFIQLGINPLAKDEEQKGDPLYQFYYHASYDLWTPFTSLRGYAAIIGIVYDRHLSKKDEFDELATQVLAPPLIPEYKHVLKDIAYWIEQLREFMFTAREQTKREQ